LTASFKFQAARISPVAGLITIAEPRRLWVSEVRYVCTLAGVRCAESCPSRETNEMPMRKTVPERLAMLSNCLSKSFANAGSIIR